MSVCRVLEKVLELAQASATRSEWASFFYSDAADLKAIREQLEQYLLVFGVSFTPHINPQDTSDTRVDPII